LGLSAEETRVLEGLRRRLRRRVDEGKEGDEDLGSERSSENFTMVPSRSETGDGVRR
jgi:hypothetical protein